MRTGAGLLLIGAGAILAFAVTTNTSVFNLHTAGYVLILIGILGLALPRRAASWVGRRLFVRRYQRHPEHVEGVIYPPDSTRNSASTQTWAGLPTGLENPLRDDASDESSFVEDTYEE